MALLANQLELLSPAKTVEIGREAILHGADAVYIGGPSFGARHNASNEVSEIAQLVEFAHRYHARIFVTMNTILHDAELEPARKLIHQLYQAGVDALIVQDMAMLELDLPAIQLHASTQCDIRTAPKAKFLGDAGFSQLVLARELTLEQIKAMNGLTSNVISPGQRLIIKQEAPQPTQAPTTDPNTAATQAAPGTQVASVGSGTLCALLYNDANGNGVRDANETLLAGGQFTVVDTTTGAPVQAYTTDGVNEPHCFDGLPAGQYTISSAPPPNHNGTGNSAYPLKI